MTFTIGNSRGPKLTLEVTNAGYLIDARQVPPDIAWLFDRAILDHAVPVLFGSLIDVYMSGIGYACETSPSDVLDVAKYVHEHWELEPC